MSQTLKRLTNDKESGGRRAFVIYWLAASRDQKSERLHIEEKGEGVGLPGKGPSRGVY